MISIRRKAIFLFFIIVSIVALVVFDAVAMDYRIFSDQIQAEAGKSITIPLKIENNQGIMGFKLTANYSKAIFKEPKVMRGSVTSVGMLSDSIQESTIDSFDVVWSNSESVYSDGVLLILQFTLDQKASNGRYVIDLTYSQPDTFNEQWEDVLLDISNITVQVGQPTESSLLTQSEESTQEHPSTTCVFDDQTDVEVVLEVIDSHFIQSEIEKQLDEIGVESIDDLSMDQFSVFQDRMSDSLDLYGVSTESNSLSKKNYLDLYQSAVSKSFVDDVLESMDGEMIKQVIANTLSTFGVEEAEAIPNDKKADFSADLQNNLKSNGAEFEPLPANKDPVDLIKELEVGVDNEQLRSVVKDDNSGILLIVLSILLLFILLSILLVLIKKRRIINT